MCLWSLSKVGRYSRRLPFPPKGLKAASGSGIRHPGSFWLLHFAVKVKVHITARRDCQGTGETSAQTAAAGLDLCSQDPFICLRTVLFSPFVWSGSDGLCSERSLKATLDSALAQLIKIQRIFGKGSNTSNVELVVTFSFF